MAIGTAVQIMTIVRMDRSGDIVPSCDTAERGEKAKSFNLLLSIRYCEMLGLRVQRADGMRSRLETNRSFIVVGGRGTGREWLAVPRASRGGRAHW
jgi:hypothetical protein